MPKIFEASGPNGLLEATEALLTSEVFDMAAVSQVIDPSSSLLEELDDGSRQNDLINRERLRSELPQLDTIEDLVKDHWVENGYRGMEIVRGFILDQWRKPGIAPHVDELIYGDRRIEAGVQLSLCVKGLRKFMAERLPHDFRNEDGAFDASGYSEFYNFNGQLFKEIMEGRLPRSEAVLRPGDVAMFPHHPAITFHGVINLEPSVARLISYNAEKATDN